MLLQRLLVCTNSLWYEVFVHPSFFLVYIALFLFFLWKTLMLTLNRYRRKFSFLVLGMFCIRVYVIIRLTYIYLDLSISCWLVTHMRINMRHDSLSVTLPRMWWMTESLIAWAMLRARRRSAQYVPEQENAASIISSITSILWYSCKFRNFELKD